MKKQKKKIKGRSRNSQFSQPSNRRVIELKSEELSAYVRQAEVEVLPLLKDLNPNPGAAIFLLAQYTQTLITSNSHLTLESATIITNSVVALWQDGFYQPGSEYPFTLEETLRDLKNGMKAQKDYSEYFQSFTPTHPGIPVGLGQIAGGIVRHPKTHLWQIWMMLDGPCEFLGTYRDPAIAQKNLEDIINAVRLGKKSETALSLYQILMSQADSEPQQIPFDMMTYLVENLQQYKILL